MNQNEYVKDVCCKCTNKSNNQDLCNIVKSRVSGNWQCANFESKKENEKEETKNAV